jgi:hypothetical protein
MVEVAAGAGYLWGAQDSCEVPPVRLARCGLVGQPDTAG